MNLAPPVGHTGCPTSARVSNSVQAVTSGESQVPESYEDVMTGYDLGTPPGRLLMIGQQVVREERVYS